MIIKKRKIPVSILKLEALIRRLPPHHPKIPLIENDLRKAVAGYKGESSLDFQLGFLDTKNSFIFHDVRLEDQSRFFQIDTFILTRKVGLIIEVKNIAGTIYFDPIFKQLIQTKDGEEKALPDPVTQIKRQESQMKQWFLNNRLESIPLTSFIVISNPQTIIRTSPENRSLNQIVIHRDNLSAKIKQIEKSTAAPTLQAKDIKKATKLLLKNHTEADYSILERYQIEKSEVLKGVICTQCKHIPLKRVHGSWYCLVCNSKSKDAHVEALKDYRLLIGPTITNSQLKVYLNITSSATTTRILHALNLTYSGQNKNRVYNLPMSISEFNS